MQLIANESGGTVLENGDPKEIAKEFDDHLSASRPQRTVRKLAWDRWWVLLSVYCLWAVAWGLRRWSGLV